MFTKLRCFDCGEKGHLYMALSEFSSFYCRQCDFAFDSDEITEYVAERRDNHFLLSSAETAEQIAEWKKVLDFILGGNQMFDTLRCFDCGEKGHLYMALSEFSSFYCSDCDSQYDSDEVSECINGRRDGRGIANTTEQIAEWQKVLDFILGR